VAACEQGDVLSLALTHGLVACATGGSARAKVVTHRLLRERKQSYDGTLLHDHLVIVEQRHCAQHDAWKVSEHALCLR
jgi:hypothetical protein